MSDNLISNMRDRSTTETFSQAYDELVQDLFQRRTNEINNLIYKYEHVDPEEDFEVDLRTFTICKDSKNQLAKGKRLDIYTKFGFKNSYTISDKTKQCLNVLKNAPKQGLSFTKCDVELEEYSSDDGEYYTGESSDISADKDLSNTSDTHDNIHVDSLEKHDSSSHLSKSESPVPHKRIPLTSQNIKCIAKSKRFSLNDSSSSSDLNFRKEMHHIKLDDLTDDFTSLSRSPKNNDTASLKKFQSSIINQAIACNSSRRKSFVPKKSKDRNDPFVILNKDKSLIQKKIAPLKLDTKFNSFTRNNSGKSPIKKRIVPTMLGDMPYIFAADNSVIKQMPNPVKLNTKPNNITKVNTRKSPIKKRIVPIKVDAKIYELDGNISGKAVTKGEMDPVKSNDKPHKLSLVGGTKSPIKKTIVDRPTLFNNIMSPIMTTVRVNDKSTPVRNRKAPANNVGKSLAMKRNLPIKLDDKMTAVSPAKKDTLQVKIKGTSYTINTGKSIVKRRIFPLKLEERVKYAPLIKSKSPNKLRMASKGQVNFGRLKTDGSSRIVPLKFNNKFGKFTLLKSRKYSPKEKIVPKKCDFAIVNNKSVDDLVFKRPKLSSGKSPNVSGMSLSDYSKIKLPISVFAESFRTPIKTPVHHPALSCGYSIGKIDKGSIPKLLPEHNLTTNCVRSTWSPNISNDCRAHSQTEIQRSPFPKFCNKKEVDVIKGKMSTPKRIRKEVSSSDLSPPNKKYRAEGKSG